MGMPNNLVIMRHGQSEGNVIQGASNTGDNSYYNNSPHLRGVPDRTWRLTAAGVQQAKTAGKWLNEHFHGAFDRHIVSPYTRTRETAGNLGLEGDVQWELNRSVRERNWGEVSTEPREVLEREYVRSNKMRLNDPLYWTAPGGESIAEVAENRVRNLLSTLHREAENKNVIIVAHGEFIWATRLVLESWDDEEFTLRDDRDKIHNCQIFHYTRINPKTGEQSPRLQWVRWIIPQDDGTVIESEWVEFKKHVYTNEELLATVEEFPHYI